MNLHSLDRKVSFSFGEGNVKFLDVSSSFGKEKDILPELLTMFNLSPPGARVLKVLINDVGTNKNFDPINNVNVDDLLLQLYHLKKKNPECFDDVILDDQLVEMLTGMCPQGRTIRLLQVLFCGVPYGKDNF